MIVLPSKLFHEMASGSTNADASRPPVSLSVQRSSFPVAVSTAYASAGDFADVKVKPSRRELGSQRRLALPIVPNGSFGRAISLRVGRSSAWSVLAPASLTE